MLSDAASRVRQRREILGISQAALAAVAGLTRQSISAIEAGRTTPGVDVALRLARALDSHVEDLFGGENAEPPVTAVMVSASAAPRVALAEIGGRWVAHPLTGGNARYSADGLSRPAGRGRVSVAPIRPLATTRENLLVTGCAPALGLLADRLNGRAGGRFIWLPASNTAALDALAHRQTHIAGVHLADTRATAAGTAETRRRAGRAPVTLITLARWEQGLLVAAGNPKRLRRVADLARPGVRLITREAGSGARQLLDAELRAAGLAFDKLRASLEAAGHLEVAQAVALGAADAGVATRDAAIAYDLDFIPLVEERYDLVIPDVMLGDPRVARLLDVMTGKPSRRELASLGYDTRFCGKRVAEAA